MDMWVYELIEGTPRASETTCLVILNSLLLIQLVK